MKHLKYLRYVLKHRFWVWVACTKSGLWWRGFWHDWHKFLPSEWFPYAEHFHGKNAKQRRDETGYYKPTDTGDSAFDMAWLRHAHRADHHWQWWTQATDEGGLKVYEMSERARLEMVCDWIGASMAQGHGGEEGVREWWKKNEARIFLGPKTRVWVEDVLMIEVLEDE